MHRRPNPDWGGSPNARDAVVTPHALQHVELLTQAGFESERSARSVHDTESGWLCVIAAPTG